MKKRIDHFRLRLALFSVFIGIVPFLSIEILINNDRRHEEELLQNSILTNAVMISQDIQRNVATGIYSTDTLANLLETSSYSTEDFNTWAERILRTSGSVSTVQLAPDGIVTMIYPLNGNEGALGHDLLKDKRRDDGAMKAVLSRELTFIGPVKLIQNGKWAVIARKPVFRAETDGSGDFWGFTIALILIDDIISSVFSEISGEDLRIRLEGDDPDSAESPVFFESEDFNPELAVELDIEVPNGHWHLSLSHPPIANEFYTLIRSFGVLLALIISSYFFIQQDTSRKKSLRIEELNRQLTELSLKDELTGTGNRRAAVQILENQIRQSERYGQPFCIVMMDMDHFKDVNDNFGHAAGDALLKHFTETTVKLLRKSDDLYRLGGDEFVIILPQTGKKEAVLTAKKLINSISSSPLLFGKDEITISLSVGIAEHAKGERIETIMQRADAEMYRAKQAGRNCISC